MGQSKEVDPNVTFVPPSQQPPPHGPAAKPGEPLRPESEPRPEAKRPEDEKSKHGSFGPLGPRKI